MTEDWREETARVVASFDAIADLYRAEFAGELNDKPLDRELLRQFAHRALGMGPVLEVGAGPGHVGAEVASYGVQVIVSDLSMGQMKEAGASNDPQPRVVADLECIPVGQGRLGGVLAFYCLIYGSADHLDAVFADWASVLLPGSLAFVAFHAGDGSIHVDDWRGRSVDMTVVLRDPADTERRLTSAGFVVEDRVVRDPYESEHPTQRAYLMARRA